MVTQVKWGVEWGVVLSPDGLANFESWSGSGNGVSWVLLVHQIFELGLRRGSGRRLWVRNFGIECREFRYYIHGLEIVDCNPEDVLDGDVCWTVKVD